MGSSPSSDSVKVHICNSCCGSNGEYRTCEIARNNTTQQQVTTVDKQERQEKVSSSFNLVCVGDGGSGGLVGIGHW